MINAIAVDMALGCSTNTVLHVPAIAKEAEVDLPLAHFNEVSRKTPHICSLIPGGPHSLQQLDEAGGVQAVMKELLATEDGLNLDGLVFGRNRFRRWCYRLQHLDGKLDGRLRLEQSRRKRRDHEVVPLGLDLRRHVCV